MTAAFFIESRDDIDYLMREPIVGNSGNRRYMFSFNDINAIQMYIRYSQSLSYDQYCDYINIMAQHMSSSDSSPMIIYEEKRIPIMCGFYTKYDINNNKSLVRETITNQDTLSCLVKKNYVFMFKDLEAIELHKQHANVLGYGQMKDFIAEITLNMVDEVPTQK